ncbi:hypothetical protein QEN19_000351 [Hanseniaspora menglaensis]
MFSTNLQEESNLISKDFILKIIYTIDNEISPFLSRSLYPITVQYTNHKKHSTSTLGSDLSSDSETKLFDDQDEISAMGFGYVNFADVLELISSNSPELFNTNSNIVANSVHEYNVYYRDVLEDKEPYVSCGFLSELNNNLHGLNVVGRVVKNFSGLVRSNGHCNDILEVKLKFSKVVNKLNNTSSRRSSPSRSLINKNSPIHVQNLIDKKSPAPLKRTKKKTSGVSRQNNFVEISSNPPSNSNIAQKSGRSSIIRKIMEKDVLISSLKEQYSQNNNIITSNNFLNSSPVSNDLFLSSSFNGSGNDTSSNLPSYYSTNSNNVSSSSTNTSSSRLNSNIIKKSRNNENEASVFENENHENNYSDINNRFDFSKMKQQKPTASISNKNKTKKVLKKKKVTKTNLKDIIKEKENLIPKVVFKEDETIIKTSTGMTFNLEDILLENDIILSPPSSQHQKLLSSWGSSEDENTANNNIVQSNSKSKLSNEIFNLDIPPPQMDSSPQTQQGEAEKVDTFFNDLKNMGINLDDSYSNLMPHGIINLNNVDGRNVSSMMLDSDFFTNLDGAESSNSNINNGGLENDLKSFSKFSSPPALM